MFAASVTLFVCAGIGFQALPVFLKFIDADMDWGRDKLSYAGAISGLAAGFITPAVGYFIDRHGPRVVMIPGAIILSLSFIGLGYINSVTQLYALHFFTGVGMAATTILPCQTLVSRWFEKKRGRAMGVISLAIGMGTVAWMPASERLISAIGWRNAYQTLGIIMAVISIPMIALIIRRSPQSMGLAIDGEVDPNSIGGSGSSEAEEPGYQAREAFRMSSFWLICLATFLVIFSASGFGLHAISFFSDSGFSPRNATLVWSATFGVSVIGRFFFGYLSENYQKRYFVSTGNSLRAFTLAVLLLFALGIIPKEVAAVQLIIIYGVGNACNAAISPLVLSETFGIKAFGKIMGMIGIPYTIGMALGMAMGGRLYEMFDNYNVAFAVFALSFLMAGITMVLAKPHFLFETQSGGRQGQGEVGMESSAER